MSPSIDETVIVDQKAIVPGPQYVAITMLDDTLEAVMIIKERLAAHGFEAIIFGSGGGPAIKELAQGGLLVGAIEFIACESSSEVVDGLRLYRLVVPVCPDFNSRGRVMDAGHEIARRLNNALGPVVVMVPTEGISRPTVESDTFLKQLMNSLSAKVQLITIEADVNSPRFANRVADEFLRMVGGTPAHRGGATSA